MALYPRFGSAVEPIGYQDDHSTYSLCVRFPMGNVNFSVLRRCRLIKACKKFRRRSSRFWGLPVEYV